MKDFYLGDKKIPILVGIVEEATGRASASHNVDQYSLELKLDTFARPVVVPAAYNLRIDKGEKVRVYSRLGFDRPVDGCGGLIKIDALQVMKEEGKVAFQYISVKEGKFRE